ncbi:hypothetical protein PSAB6_290020 [Paraburkholderia sabiae]|nr:hypothetical protein PSAB6_290020 [Paraburkholderia sabiae]
MSVSMEAVTYSTHPAGEAAVADEAKQSPYRDSIDP